MKRIATLIVLVWLSAGSGTFGATYYVATNGDDSRTGLNNWTNAVATIGNAVAKVSGSSLILVSNGTYVLNATINVPADTTIRSFHDGMIDQTNTVVDGHYPVLSNGCFSLAGGNTVVDGFKIINGCSGGKGGGVYMSGNPSSLLNCIVTNCRANYGGGVEAEGTGNISVSNCVFEWNLTTNNGCGGGIYIYATSYTNIVVEKCLVGNNSAWRGGGVYARGQVIDCNISNNHSVSYGGGVCMMDGPGISNCWVEANTCDGSGYGAGVAVLASTVLPLITHCTIAGNVNQGNAGGLYFNSGGTAVNCVIRDNYGAGNAGGVMLSGPCTLKNCLIYNNRSYWSSSYFGGGIYEDSPSTSARNIINCTIVSNRAYKGGGVYWRTTNVFLTDCIIVSNAAASSQNADLYTTNTASPNVFASCCTSFDMPYNGNITNNPRFVDFAGHDFHLSAGSPGINAGTNQSWMAGAVDLNGFPRIDQWSGIVDMGAYEYLGAGTMILLRSH